MSRYDSDDVRRVSPHLRAGGGVSRAGASAAEISAAVDGVTKGERELAAAMYKRAQSRWRAFAEYEMAN